MLKSALDLFYTAAAWHVNEKICVIALHKNGIIFSARTPTALAPSALDGGTRP